MSELHHRYAKEIYKLLKHHPAMGMTGKELAAKLKTDRRGVRYGMELCKRLAASHDRPDIPLQIVGYDPGRDAYFMAQNAEQSERIIRHLNKRVSEEIETLTALCSAHVERFGKPAPKAVQETLFKATDYQKKMGLEAA